MLESARVELEHDVRRRCAAGDFAGAATVALRGYGPEVYGFLVAFHRREEDAAEVFSLFSERLWRGLERFGWQSSFRTWAYSIARNSSFKYRRDAQRRARHHVPLPDGSSLDAVAAEVRTQTKSYLVTQKRTRLEALRDSLPVEDRELLVLRVDKRLSWNDLAEVLRDDEAPLDAAATKREAARLRKRFQLVKERLLEMGRREGLVGTGDKEG